MPVAGDLLFTLGEPAGAIVKQGGRGNPSLRVNVLGSDLRSELHASQAIASMVRYEMRGGIAAPGFVPADVDRRVALSPRARAFFTRVPDDVPASVRALTSELVAGAVDDVERAQRLRTFLLSQFTYTLDQPAGGAEKPLYAFLVDVRAGHCEYFASAYALLLRSLGIPARVIGGYQGGAWDPDDGLVVFTGANAHAWVEWFADGKGWIVDDPTPAATGLRRELTGFAAFADRVQRLWDDAVVDYAFVDQVRNLNAARRALAEIDETAKEVGAPLVAIAAVLVAAFVVVRVVRGRRRARARADASPLVQALLAAIARCDGNPVAASATVREAVLSSAVATRAVVRRALDVYERDRFAAEHAPPDDVAALVRALDALVAPKPSTVDVSAAPR
jgi:transglutaminase-like putative cysteine protease